MLRTTDIDVEGDVIAVLVGHSPLERGVENGHLSAVFRGYERGYRRYIENSSQEIVKPELESKDSKN